MNGISYSLDYDLGRDIWNWYYGANYSENGEEHFKNVDDLSVLKQIKGIKKLEDAEPILRPYLQSKSDDAESELNGFLRVANAQFAEYFQVACEKMEEITDKPLANDRFTFYVTTFPRMVVFYEEGIVFLYAKIDNELWGMPLDGFMHELLHFQTDKYWRQDPNSLVSRLSEDDYFRLKESLTVILDEELKPIMTLPDCSYPEYGELREKLHDHWKKNHDFDALVNYGLGLL